MRPNPLNEVVADARINYLDGGNTMEVKFTLQYCGIEESDDFDCTGMSQEEIEKELEKELVQWVLERVDHWSEPIEDGGSTE
jgi:hypothetical protein